MTKVATLLQTVRLEKGYELSEISKKIRIPIKYLQAFEEGDCSRYPHEPYCSLSVKEYADFLGLDGQEILRLFRRDYIQKTEKKDTIIKNNGVTPKATFAFAVIFIVCLFAFYLFNEYLKFSQPPLLTVNWPKTTTSDLVDVSGKTNPEATVRINQDLVIVDTDGNFTKKINLRLSPKIIIESKSPNGKITVWEKNLSEISK